MLDHISLNVVDYDASRHFYEHALAPLGMVVVMALEERGMCGFGDRGKPDFWICQRGEPSAPTHVAFTAEDRATVDAFHVAALGACGAENGAPGPRPQYHAGYYGAFVLDPDGNNIEAVCHRADP